MDENERKKGMNQGIWLAVQELVYAGRWTQRNWCLFVD
jgi:hypothetical protein